MEETFEKILVEIRSLISKASWKVGASRDLPLVQRGSWDGSAAKERIFSWAGWPDNPQPSKARRAFLLYDASAPELKGSYKDPFADVVNGRLVAVSAGLRAAASRLPQTSSVPENIRTRARSVIDHYQNKMKKSGYLVEKSTSEGIIKDVDVFMSEDEAQQRATELGCSGFHTINIDGQAVFMPCPSHEQYLESVSSSEDSVMEKVIEKSWEADLIVKSEKKQLAYGVVYPALAEDKFDLQGDRAREDEIEKMAHGFMISFIQDLMKGVQTRGMDLDHISLVTIADAVPVESYVAPQDIEINGKTINKGSWVMVTKIFKPELWQAIEDGRINAYSIRGFGKRKPINTE